MYIHYCWVCIHCYWVCIHCYWVWIPQAHLTELLATSHWMKTPNAAGILLFNLVFHDVLPLVCHSLDYDVRKVAPP